MIGQQILEGQRAWISSSQPSMSAATLQYLHAFSTVAAKRGIRQSTNTLYRKSPAVVRSAAVLEKNFNIHLFENDKRGMMLTIAGETVLVSAQAIASELRGVHDDAVRFAARDGGSVGDMEMLFNERCLQIVSMVADVRDVTSVARTIGMSQSAASQLIANLEDALGRALFRRTDDCGMLPSDVGIRWIARFKRVLAELNHIKSVVATLKCL